MQNSPSFLPLQQGWWAISIRASIESVLICAMVGSILFFPFIHQYHFINGQVELLVAFFVAAVVTSGLLAGLFLPLLAILKGRKISMSGNELAGTLLVLAIFAELLGYLLLKGFHGPAYRGKLLLFAVMMDTALASWLFANRLSAITRIFQSRTS